jgi:hypothetical protein
MQTIDAVLLMTPGVYAHCGRTDARIRRSALDRLVRGEIARSQNSLHVCFSTGLAEGSHLFVHSAPLAAQRQIPGDDDIDFGGAVGHGCSNFL